MRRVIGLLLAAVAGLFLLYLSRFWTFNLWSGGLLGIKDLRPGGGLLARWLRGTELAPFELLIWAALVFMSLTYLQKFFDRISKSK